MMHEQRFVEKAIAPDSDSGFSGLASLSGLTPASRKGLQDPNVPDGEEERGGMKRLPCAESPCGFSAAWVRSGATYGGLFP